MTELYEAHYRDGYYVDTATGRVIPPDPGHYKKHRDGYLWADAAVSEAERLNAFRRDTAATQAMVADLERDGIL